MYFWQSVPTSQVSASRHAAERPRRFDARHSALGRSHGATPASLVPNPYTVTRWQRSTAWSTAIAPVDG